MVRRTDNNRVIGVLMVVVGVLFPTVFFPLSVYNTFSLGVPTVSCSSSNSCSVNISVTNNNATEQANLWFGFSPYPGTANSGKPYAESPAQWFNQLITSNPGQTQSYSQNLGIINNGYYVITVKAIGLSGQLLSMSSNANFYTPNLTLLLDPLGSGDSVTVTQSVNGGGAQAVTGTTSAIGTVYQVASNSQVSLSATLGPTQTLPQWTFYAGQSGQSTANPLSFPINQNVEVSLGSACNAACNAYFVTAVAPFAGAVSPTTAQQISQTVTSQTTTSASFTATPNSNYRFYGWYILGTSGVIFRSTSNPLTLGYSDLANAGAQLGVPVTLYANFTIQPRLTVFDNSAYPGKVALSPTPGQYYETQGSQVTVTASNVASGYSFGGWIVDGNNYPGSSLTYTLTMNANHFIAPIILKNSVGTTTTTVTGAYGQTTTTVATTTKSATTATGSGNSFIGLAIGIPLIFGGAILIFKRRGRR